MSKVVDHLQINSSCLCAVSSGIHRTAAALFSDRHLNCLFSSSPFSLSPVVPPLLCAFKRETHYSVTFRAMVADVVTQTGDKMKAFCEDRQK